MLLSGLAVPQQKTHEQQSRSAASGAGWTEIFISPSHASRTPRTADAVAAGFSLLVLHDLAHESECTALRSEASAVARKHRRCNPVDTSVASADIDVAPSRELVSSVEDDAVGSGHVVRKHVLDFFCESAHQTLCDRLLLRGVSRLHSACPTLLPALFGEARVGCVPLRQLEDHLQPTPPSITRNPGLVFTPGEPACNVYTAGGEFKPHEDGHALTVLVVLSEYGSDYGGGGTAFWSEKDKPLVIKARQFAAAVHKGESAFLSGCWTLFREALLDHGASRAPTLVLRPPAGSALCFGGNVYHAGVALETGERSVLVASFSNG